MNEKCNAGENSPKKTQSTLWEFALAAYAEPIIQRHCLYLQDHYQMDVNILLAAGFCGREGRRWTSSLCGELIDLAAPIRERYVLPLRALRREAEANAGLYGALKAAEIEAERVEIDALCHHLAIKTAASEGDAPYLDNILTYAALVKGVSQGDLAPKFKEIAERFADIP
ncbi:TIGR02444 family protein [Zhongshania sp.]|uniref:TIGR02444 family protein n=1 Tax=Zhongshania sp. TaxID=1971902 RepID=UPI001B6146DE|nr:TIGR02444 family protein [Zhongshania sp.]MBQ0797501.1 TIGR02444 family protein [Zhongshania sp.]